jgi:hypothetical protein
LPCMAHLLPEPPRASLDDLNTIAAELGFTRERNRVMEERWLDRFPFERDEIETVAKRREYAKEILRETRRPS